MGNATKSDEVKTGRAIWLDTNHRRNIVTLSKGTCRTDFEVSFALSFAGLETLTSAKFAAHSMRSATGRTADSKHLFGVRLLSWSKRIAPTAVKVCSILTTLSH